MTPIDDSPLLFAGPAGFLLFEVCGCSPLSRVLRSQFNQPVYLTLRRQRD